MRPILLVVVAVAAFFVWDGLANKSAYRITAVTNLEQLKEFPGMVKVSWNN
ncbi:hypothetical protein [Mesorhizobium hawassense]|uniref:hypothetical protein n=1 Tax=Mesorhizobium hawassense TaxID=1209954 RepID=UPI00142E15DA|nr:hypothetical protein [Mesorhizobium hawassense]